MIRFLIYFGLIWLAGCGRTSPTALPTTHMNIGAQDFSIEIATSPHDQEVGLMHRDFLGANQGMIFPFPDQKEREFWNHDVHFSLDLVFLDAGGSIVSIKRLEAWSERRVYSDAAAQYAIELGQGTAQRLHLEVGQHLAIPPDAQHADAAAR
jgi:uncharacterized membrane protein (UPF0127 family)